MFYINWLKSRKKLSILVFPLILVFCESVLSVETEDINLTLGEAEELALESDSLIRSISATAEALDYQSVADGQLADPMLKIGAMNFPLDTFDRGQEPMTQLQIGVQQKFPRGRTLQHSKNRTEALSAVETARVANQQLVVLQFVRKAYIELFFQIQSEDILKQHEQLFTQLLDITQRQYAVGRDNQHDVLRAQLELSLLQDRLVEIDGLKASSIAELAKWIGHKQALRPLPDVLPTLPSMPSLSKITEALGQHPLIRVQDSVIDVNRQQVAIAEEQYKPAWMVDVTYGERTGRDFNGSGRTDFFSAMLLVEIPLFTNKRQDKRLAASKKRHLAAKFARTDKHKELARLVERDYARWEQLQKRYSLYESRTIIDAEQNAEATLKAYQSDVTDFTALMRARLTELNTKLAMLRLLVGQSKVQADLLYFLGESS